MHETIPAKRLKTRLFKVYRSCDIPDFVKLLEERDAYFCGVIEVPFWNVDGHQVSTEYAIIYQSHEEIEMSICT